MTILLSLQSFLVLEWKHLNDNSNKQIHKPLAQQETLSLEKSEMLVAPLHLEKSITLLQETFELHFEKISKTAANIECCQNQNTTTLQQNIANLKKRVIF